MAFWQKVNEKAQEVLKRGDSGDQVKDLQTKLNQNGANLEVDGVFGPQTEAEVKKLQQNNGLTVDGKVGPETRGFWDKTISAGKEALASKNNAPGTSTAPKEFTYEDFTYNDYKESPVVSQALSTLQQQLAAKPGAYQSTWQGQINGIIDRIMNREDFSYDVNSDALYQQYKDQYSALGKLAMQDTMGQAAGLTGGYGSSYASTAGNQAYQSYLSQLNDVVPELYGMARDQYNQEGQEMYNQYGLLVDQENQDYGRYVDKYNQWASERNHLQGVYSEERNFDYGKYVDDKSYAYNEHTQKQAYEQAKASGGSGGSGGAGGDAEELQYFKELPYPDIIDTIENYVTPDKDGSTNLFAAEGFIDDLYVAGRIDEAEWKRLRERYLPATKDKYDTTVPPNKFSGGPVGGGVGKFATQNAIKN